MAKIEEEITICPKQDLSTVWKCGRVFGSGFHVRSECTVHEMLTATAASVCVSADLRASVHLRPADETVAENV